MQYSVYIISNTLDTVLYIGCTDDLAGRIWEHRNKVIAGSFSDRYNLWKLVYYEDYDNKDDAYIREYQIKKWRRQKKIDLIKSLNPRFEDLYKTII